MPLTLGVDAGEIEKQRCRKEELEESVIALEESFKSLLMEQKHLENEGADLQRQRVCGKECKKLCCHAT